MLIILDISDKQGEAELYPDSGNRINVISAVYYVCPCLGQQVRETVEILFVICFEPFFFFSLSSGGPVCEGVAVYES